MKHIACLILLFTFLSFNIFAQNDDASATPPTSEVQLSINIERPVFESPSDQEKMDIILDEINITDFTFKLLMEKLVADVQDEIKARGGTVENFNIIEECISAAAGHQATQDIINYSIEIHMNNFSLDELRQLVKFYKTEAGQKSREINLMIGISMHNTLLYWNDAKDVVLDKYYKKKDTSTKSKSKKKKKKKQDLNQKI